MLGDFKRYYRAMRLKAAAGNMNEEQPEVPVPIPQTSAQVKEMLRNTFSGSMDFNLKEFEGGVVLMAFLDDMVDKLLVSETVVAPVMQAVNEMKTGGHEKRKAAFLKDKLTTLREGQEMTDYNKCVVSILSGGTVLFIDGDTTALSLSLQKYKMRAVEESNSESISRGSREGFTEVLSVNITMLRRIIKDSSLIFENFIIGRQTKTDVAMCYIKGLANQEIIDEVRKRLRNIKTDAILESGYIEAYIEDAPFSIFPTVFNSERPDAVAGKLLEGRVAILCSGTPIVLTVPSLFVDYLQYGEDYNNRWLYTTVIRPIRLFAFLISITAPAFYIALLCFHHDVVPFKLLLTITESLVRVPLPPLVEMLALTILFEIIKESGLRMARPLAGSVSIVSGLIVGQAAVQAGIFSTAAVVIIAMTSVSAFIISKLDATVFIIRVTLMFAANIIGILGIVLCLMAFFIHACSLKSFGVPYLSPITPLSGKDMKDTFMRMPLWAMLEKPESITRRYVQKDTSGN